MVSKNETEKLPKVALEDVFSSKGRVRILKLLAELGELNVSAISRNINFHFFNFHPSQRS